MDKQLELKKLESRAFAARVPMYKLCQSAGVAASTVSRWRRDSSTMTASTLKKLENALSELEGSQ